MRTIYKIQGTALSEWEVEKETEKCLFLKIIYPHKSSLWGSFRLLKSELGKQHHFTQSFTEEKEQAIEWMKEKMNTERVAMDIKEARYKKDMERLNDNSN